MPNPCTAVKRARSLSYRAFACLWCSPSVRLWRAPHHRGGIHMESRCSRLSSQVDLHIPCNRTLILSFTSFGRRACGAWLGGVGDRIFWGANGLIFFQWGIPLFHSLPPFLQFLTRAASSCESLSTSWSVGISASILSVGIVATSWCKEICWVRWSEDEVAEHGARHRGLLQLNPRSMMNVPPRFADGIFTSSGKNKSSKILALKELRNAKTFHI